MHFLIICEEIIHATRGEILHVPTEMLTDSICLQCLSSILMLMLSLNAVLIFCFTMTLTQRVCFIALQWHITVALSAGFARLPIQ